MRVVKALLLLGLGTGVSFGQAKKSGSEALRSFAEEYPKHKKAAVAVELADSLDWEEAEAANTEAGYLAYVEQSPGGANVEEAWKRADLIHWEVLPEGAAALRAHLEAYPNGKHQFEGWRTLERQELAEVRLEPSLEAFVQHFKRFPRHPTSTETAAEIGRRVWEKLDVLRDADTPIGRMMTEVDLSPPAKKLRAERFLDYAWHALLLGETEIALQLTDLLVRYDDAKPEVWTLRARIYRRLGDHDLEGRQVAQARAQAIPGRAAIYAQALLHVRKGEFDGARMHLQSVEVVDSPHSGMKTGVVKFKNPDPHFYLYRAALYAAEGKPLAWREYQLALERLPRHPLITQITFIEELGNDPLFEPLRQDERFQGGPELFLD